MGNQAMTGMDDEVPMTGMDDVERQAPHGDTEILEKKKKAARDSRILCEAVIFGVLVAACVVLPLLLFALGAHYYVAIDSVSNLDPTMGLSFNLTVGLSSWGLAARSCIEPGTYAQVSYRGVLLAASEAQVGRLCGWRGKSVEQHVVSAARVTWVPVGGVMDSLAAHMRQGTPEFDVTLHLPAGSYGVGGGENWVSRCKGTGVAAAAVWCDNPKREPTL